MNIKNLINCEISQDEYLRFKNATLLFKKLPNEVNGMIVRKNDFNIIIINDYLSDEDKKTTFLHEIAHLELNHTYEYKISNDNSSIFEQEVDNYINNLKFD